MLFLRVHQRPLRWVGDVRFVEHQILRSVRRERVLHPTVGVRVGFDLRRLVQLHHEVRAGRAGRVHVHAERLWSFRDESRSRALQVCAAVLPHAVHHGLIRFRQLQQSTACDVLQ